MDNNSNIPSGNEDPRPPYVPAPVPKRIVAWIGVVYMVIIVFLTIVPFFRGGTPLRGVGPLLVCPGTAGLLVLCLWQLRQPDCPSAKKAGMVTLAVACGAIFIMGLVDGIPALLLGLGVGA